MIETTKETTNDTRLLSIPKEQERAIRFLESATAGPKDYRPQLEAICVHDGASYATDGYRLHAVKTPTCLTDDGAALIRIANYPPGSPVAVLTCQEETDTYPDIAHIVPTSEPVFTIHVSAKILRDTLEQFKDKNNLMVALRFHGPMKPIEVLGKLDDNTEAYALLMPMNPNCYRALDKQSEPVYTWRPVAASIAQDSGN